MYVNGSSVNKYHITTYGEDFGYKDFIPMFNGSKFNATEWASLYARAGARYAGPVAEHADGYAMFDSKLSDFTAVKTGPKRDVTKEVTTAVRALGMKAITTLHHQWLWAWYPTWDSNTDCGDPTYQLTPQHGGLYGPKVASAKSFDCPCNVTKAFQDYFLGKSLEVVHGYQPDLVYFDSKLRATIDDDHRLAFLAGYYNAADDWMKKGTSTGVTTTYKNQDMQWGSGTLDFERGGSADIQAVPWQTDDAMDRHSWSWVNPPSLKNATELIGELVDIVSKNGCFLLDVPPHADGSFSPVVVDTLEQIGNWLSINGQAIYSTVPHDWFGEGPTKIIPGGFHEWPLFKAKDFRFTRAGNALFAMAFTWEADGYTITTLNSSAPIAHRISDVALVGSNLTLQWAVKADGLHIFGLPEWQPVELDFAFTFRLHLDQSALAFVLLSLPNKLPNGDVELQWNCAKAESSMLKLQYRQSSDTEWQTIEGALPAALGRYQWHPNSSAKGMVEVRLQALDEPEIFDITEVFLA